jgi:hypothetical protein
MARTKGATNKTPREKETEAKFLRKQAKDQRRIKKLEEQIATRKGK